jgi:hypothetical protein
VAELPVEYQKDISTISGIEAVPNILQVVCHATGMGFAAVARVTEGRWIACSVLDQIDFRLKASGELRVETMICHEIRQSGQGVVIDNVAEDVVYCCHPTPAMYGFQSYISMPISPGEKRRQSSRRATEGVPEMYSRVLSALECFDMAKRHPLSTLPPQWAYRPIRSRLRPQHRRTQVGDRTANDVAHNLQGAVQ